MQALYQMALEPVSERLADTCSHGFRMFRSCHDAIADIFQKLCRRQSPQFILEGDIKGCFDNIAHPWMLENIPLNTNVLKMWLKSGFVEKGRLFPTNVGTPQGGIISPTLANMTLDGLQNHIYKTLNIKASPNGRTKRNTHQVYLIRYADDFVVTANNAEILTNTVKPAIEEFLAIRGLQLSAEKTVITNINKGFDFLGFNIRKYKGKLLIKPSKSAIKSVKLKVSELLKRLQAVKTDELIRGLNSIIRGWGYYYHKVVSKEIFSAIDDYILQRCVRWCKKRHPRKQWHWIKQKYFRRIGLSAWNFSGDKQVILKLSSIPILRHVKVIGNANPFDTQFIEYFDNRKVGQQRIRGRALIKEINAI